jgi:hypothetical protein
MLSVVYVRRNILYCHAECRYAECRHAQCHYAQCHYAECRYAECRYAECRHAECRHAECRHAECHGAKKLDQIRLGIFRYCASSLILALPYFGGLTRVSLHIKSPMILILISFL